MIILAVGIENSTPIGGTDERRWLRGITKETLKDTAEFWHTTILPIHFSGSGRFAYSYQPRTKFYLNVVKEEEGQGAGRSKANLLNLTGKSSRFMRHAPRITASAKRATVTMRPPKYYTSPFVGTYTGPDGQPRRITQQPDKPDETLRTNARDRGRMAGHAIRRFDHYANTSLPVRRTEIKG